MGPRWLLVSPPSSPPFANVAGGGPWPLDQMAARACPSREKRSGLTRSTSDCKWCESPKIKLKGYMMSKCKAHYLCVGDVADARPKRLSRSPGLPGTNPTETYSSESNPFLFSAHSADAYSTRGAAKSTTDQISLRFRWHSFALRDMYASSSYPSHLSLLCRCSQARLQPCSALQNRWVRIVSHSPRPSGISILLTTNR